MPGTDLMPTGAAETFTGSNGATPNATNIVVALNQGTGGAITIQSNGLRMRTGTAQFNRLSIRLGSVSVSNCEVEFTWTVAATSVLFAHAIIRSNNTIDAGHGYLFSLEPNDMTCTRHNPTTTYAGPDLSTITHGFTAGQVVRTRIAIFADRIRARTWLAANPEPTSTWQMDYTDTSGAGGFTTAGSIGFTASAATAGSKDFFMDDIDVHDTITPTQATLAAGGSITPAGACVKRTNKAFAGSTTPTGALTKMRVVVRAFVGSITPAGALLKAFPRVFTGSTTPAGAFAKRANKKFAGTTTPAATIIKRPNRRFAGSITPTGVGVVDFLGRVFGRPGTVVMTLIQRAEVRVRYRKG